jgi:hypothetical protein
MISQMTAFKKAHRKGANIGGKHYCLVEERKGGKKTGGRGGGPGRVMITLGPGEDINDFL